VEGGALAGWHGIAQRPTRRVLGVTAVAVVLTVIGLVARLALGTDPVDRVAGADYSEIVKGAVSSYKQNGFDYRPYLADYSALGPYLNWGLADKPSPIFDGDGIPLVKNGDALVYNPVTIAQYALREYAMYSNGDRAARSRFTKSAEKLLAMEEPDGSLPYKYGWDYYLTKQTFKPGWLSGMAQGQALSVYARALDVTRDSRYLDAGRRALTLMMKPIANGGTASTLVDLRRSWSSRPFIEEYIAQPYSYTLNGYMFALLGLYDWSRADPSSRASSDFAAGLESLKTVLPLYDLKGFSAYDLGYINYRVQPHTNAVYHMIHIYQLHALNSVAPDPVLAHWEKVWATDVS
jgi:hypothetical protein